MTLTTYPQLEQGSDEWLEARRGIVTASVIGKLITPTLKVASNDTSRTLTRLLVAERITGRIEPTFTSDAMMRGRLDEPIARDVYREHYSPVREFGFYVREFDGGARLGYSPDGVVGGDGLIEIKSAEPKIQVARILGAPIEHMHVAQMQAGMLVTGRAWCDFVSYAGGLPMMVRRVEADPAWQAAITDAVATFHDEAAQMERAFTLAAADYPATEYIEHFPQIEV